jgi:hypothetical protein
MTNKYFRGSFGNSGRDSKLIKADFTSVDAGQTSSFHHFFMEALGRVKPRINTDGHRWTERP